MNNKLYVGSIIVSSVGNKYKIKNVPLDMEFWSALKKLSPKSTTRLAGQYDYVAGRKIMTSYSTRAYNSTVKVSIDYNTEPKHINTSLSRELLAHRLDNLIYPLGKDADLLNPKRGV